MRGRAFSFLRFCGVCGEYGSKIELREKWKRLVQTNWSLRNAVTRGECECHARLAAFNIVAGGDTAFRSRLQAPGCHAPEQNSQAPFPQGRFIGTTANVFPKGAKTFKTVPICGLVSPFSILAIIGCATPESSSNFFWLSPLSFLALINSPIKATRRSLSAISSDVKISRRTSSQFSPMAEFFDFSSILFMETTSFYQIFQFPSRFFYFSRRCFLRLFHKHM